MLKSKFPLAVALFGLVIVTTARAGEPPAGGAGADTKFVNNAARDGEAEVILGKLAAEKAKSEDVKKCAQQMADDHTKANEELKTIAKSKEIDLEKAAAMGTKKGERISQKLNKLEGDEFDKGYVAIMIKEHESAVKQFKAQSEKGDDADLKAFAAKTLPTLEHHLEMVKELQSKVGKPAGGAGGGRKGEGGSDDTGKPKLGPTDGEAKPAPGEDQGKKKQAE